MGSVLSPTPSGADGNGDVIHLKAQGHVATLPAAEDTVISEDGKTLPRPTQAFHVAHFLPHPAASMTLDIKH